MKILFKIVGIIILIGISTQTMSKSPIFNIRSMIKNRVIKTYNCLMGSDSCSPDEVILTRLVAIMVSMELYRRLHVPLWWIEGQRQQVLKRNNIIVPDDQKEETCCTCYGEEMLDLIPCKNKHPQQLCTLCLRSILERKMICPMRCGPLLMQ